ncbi:MAG: hypothetical protein JNK29_13810 [Anaerolineales bacterium]|nr:hypothetical protein [Anaerolineales bacterium]
MSEQDFLEALPALLTATVLLCCCCVVLIGGGVGAFFYFRSRRKPGPAAAATVEGQSRPVSTPPASFVPSMGGVPQAAEPPAAPAPAGPPSPFGLPAEPPAPAAEPPSAPAPEAPIAPAAGPIEPDDIRAKLLALNGSDKPYVVQATGYKIAIAPTAITGYLLEIAFDYVEKVARFVESNPLAAEPSIRFDARQVLEAEGWTVRE